MAGLISQSIKNMVAGVSQQPQILRMPDQAEEQINGYSSESHGLLKRPPTKHVAKLSVSNQEVNNGFFHFINRDETEKYLVLVSPYSNAPVQAQQAVSRNSTMQEHLLTAIGSHTLNIPEKCTQIEVYALGGGGGGGGGDSQASDGGRGGNSSAACGSYSHTAEGGGGGLRDTDNGASGGTPGGGGGGTSAVGGNPGTAGYKDSPGQGGVPPTNIFNGSYGYGGSGGARKGGGWSGDYGAAGGGGGSGGYLRVVYPRPDFATQVTITVGGGGAAGSHSSTMNKAWPQPGIQGAVKVIFYIQEDTGGGDGGGDGDGGGTTPPGGGGSDKPLTETSLRVFDLSGREFAVKATEESGSYLNVSSGTAVNRAIRAVTVADYTFLLNREKIVEMTSKLSASRQEEALVYIKQGNYGKKYAIMINGVEKAAYQVPDGTSASHSVQAGTDHICKELAAKLTANNIAHNKGANWINIPLASVNDAVDTSDGFGDQAMFAIKRKVQKVADLPKTAPDGYIVEVAGDKTTSADNYWLRYHAQKKTWEETVEPGLEVQINKHTMPHALVRQADGSFELKAIDWDERKIGDDGSCPIPSFVGNTIKDIFFFRNRLGFIADENVILSSSGRFFKFWNNSASTIVDTDPIDVAVSNNSVAILEHALPFNEELLLFAPQTQFILRSDGTLSPKSIRVDKTTDFRNSVNVRPIGVGRNAYFLMEKTGSTDLIEFFATEEAMMDGLPLTSHVPHYIPRGVTKLAGATSENLLLLGGFSGADARSVYAYKYLFTEQGRVQSSWSRWDFGAGSRVIAYDFVDSHIYFVIHSESGLYLESMQTNPNVFEHPNQPWKIYLDRLVEFEVPTDGFSVSANTTAFHLGNVYDGLPRTGDYFMVDETGDTQKLTWDVTGKVELYGDWRGKKVWIGEMFPFQYTFSRFLFKQEGQNGWVTETEGKLMLRRAYVNYSNSGAFTVRVNSLSTDNYRESTYTGRTMGTFANKLGRIPLGSGRFNYPIGREANDAEVTITSYNPYPVSFIGAGWEGLMARRTTKA